MGLIDSEEAAKRLARVILSDIRLYNREKIRSGADLKAEIQEGYTLFRSRVVPDLVPLFETVLADNRLGLNGAPSGAPAPVAPGVKVPPRATMPPPRPRPSMAPPAPAEVQP